MSHPNQRLFLHTVRLRHPRAFLDVIAIDVGSKNINGCNRPLFRGNSHYIGIDLSEGPNVDVVGRAHLVLPALPPCDTIISTEALEHDSTYGQTLLAMYTSLKGGGLMVITCAGEGRQEHGTDEHEAWCSPDTTDYYKNVTNAMFAAILRPAWFESYHLRQHKTDLQFYGVKKI
jgi:hypothetical protein